MDQELLEYLQAFRAENAKQFDALGQEVRSLRGETERRFDETTQRFDGVNQEVRSLREETGQRLEEVNQEFHSIRGRFDKLENDVQGVYVVVEDLRGKVQLVAEGVAGVTQQLQRQGEELSRRLDTVKSFNRLIYKDLDSRVKRLEAT